ncbi:O-antigen ligase family protein [Kocuria oceani]|uniref:O-antigen ligase family protein n=1 Tax=Kocuria oceani TaxID=988827 RepID=A0ABV9TFM5_9MICC|nr:O-antigen ligase family protein [Kocuria oceani]
MDVREVTVVDIALTLAIMFSLLSWAVGGRTMHLRLWMLLPPIGSILIVAIGVLFRQDTNVGLDYILRIFFGTTLIAILINSEGATRGASGLMRLLHWWAFGIVVNAVIVALTDTGTINTKNFVNNETGTMRAIGLAFHPNSLAFSLAIALPVLTWLWSRPGGGRLAKFIWLGGFLVCMNALYLADSRAGLLVGASAGLVGIFIAIRSTWARLLSLPLAFFAGVALLHYVPPLLATTRFANRSSAASDSLRIQYNTAALDAFATHPVFGSGFGSMTGVAIPLQLLSSGGFVLLMLYTAFIAAPTLQFFSKTRSALSNYGLLVVGTIIGFGLLNSALTERVTYWAPLIIASIIKINNRVTIDTPRAAEHCVGRPNQTSQIDVPTLHGTPFPLRGGTLSGSSTGLEMNPNRQ